MALPTVDELVALLDQKTQTDLGAAEARLFKEHGLEALVPGFVLAARPPTPARSGARVPFCPIRWQISQVPLVR